MDKNKNNKEDLSWSKKIVACVIILAELQICATYVLAFLDKTTIAEQLSIQTTVTILGALIGYLLKAGIENLSKHGVFTQESTKKVQKTKSSKNDEDVAG